jgi:hypothetical protein
MAKFRLPAVRTREPHKLPRIPNTPANHPTPEETLFPDGSGRLGPDRDDYGRLPVSYARPFYFVFCPHCDQPNKSPFSKLELWDLTDVIIRKFNNCEYCGTRYQVRTSERKR